MQITFCPVEAPWPALAHVEDASFAFICCSFQHSWAINMFVFQPLNICSVHSYWVKLTFFGRGSLVHFLSAWASWLYFFFFFKVSLCNTHLWNGEIAMMISGGRFNDQMWHLPAPDPLCCVLHDADSDPCGILSQAMLLPNSEGGSSEWLPAHQVHMLPWPPAVLRSYKIFLHSFSAVWSSLWFCKHTRMLLPQDFGTGFSL